MTLFEKVGEANLVKLDLVRVLPAPGELDQFSNESVLWNIEDLEVSRLSNDN